MNLCQAVIRSRRRHSVIRNLSASLLQVIGRLRVMGLCSMSVALDQDQRRSGLRPSMARALQAGLLQVPSCSSATALACAVFEIVSVQEKRRSRRPHSGPKTWQASRLQVS